MCAYRVRVCTERVVPWSIRNKDQGVKLPQSPILNRMRKHVVKISILLRRANYAYAFKLTPARCCRLAGASLL